MRSAVVRRRVLVLLPVLLLLGLVSVPAIHAAPLISVPRPVERATPAQPITANTCADLVSDRAQLHLEIPDAGPPGGRRSPYPLLCLLHYAEEDIFQAVIIGLDGVGHFRAVKAAAVDLLVGAGIDLCSIGTWDAYGRFSASERLRPDDVLDLPVECAPRVLAADPGAAGRLGEIREVVTHVVNLTGEQMGWRPNRALTILAITDAEVAVAIALKYARGLPPEEVAARAREGRSVTIGGSQFGSLILLNLVGARNISAELAAALAHEYTHFAQAGIGGASEHFPYWFIEGQGDYQEERNSSVRFAHREVALRMQRAGTAPRLSALVTGESWFELERRLGSAAVYSRAYVAVIFLVERHGFAATVQLLRDNRNGSIERFNTLLAALTGLDPEVFDDALGAWVLAGMPPFTAQSPVHPPPVPGSPPPTALVPAGARFTAVDSRGIIFVEFTTNADGTRASGVIRFDRDFPCPRTFIPAGAGYTFNLTIRPDGTFAGTGVSGTAVVTLDGRFLSPTEMTGALRYNNTIGTGCDTGLLAFVARRVG